MLIERPQWVIGVIAAIVVLIGTFFAAAMTGGTAFVRGDRFAAEFTDAAGVKAGDFVFVSGVRAGQVTEVRQVPGSVDPEHADSGPIVVIEFALTTSARLPADIRAEVILSNTLGRRAILLGHPDLSPAHLERVGVLTSAADRPEIPLSRTRTVVDLPEFGERTTDLLTELDVDALRELTTAVADVTEGQRDDVARLLDGVSSLSDMLIRRRDELGLALDRAEAIVDVLNSRDREVIQIIDNFQGTLTTLLTKQDDIRRVLVETANAAGRTADLVGERRTQLDRIIADITEALDVVDRRQVDLAHLLPYLDAGIDGWSNISYVDLAKNDTGQWANVFTTSVGLVGIEALAGCGGLLDVLLTDLIGPDSDCTGDEAPTVDIPLGTTSSTGGASGDRTGVLDAFFRAGLDLDAMASPASGGAS